MSKNNSRGGDNLHEYDIEDKLITLCPQTARERVLNHLKQYHLTPRKREVAYFWLMNYSVLRIAHELGITEGSVRNVIKKVYSKTEVDNQGQFISEFME